MSDASQSPRLPEPVAPAAGPPLRPLGGWSTAAWGLLALVVGFAAEAVVLVVFLVRWLALNPGATLDVDKVVYDGYLISLGVIVSATVQCGVVILSVRRTRWRVADYLGLARRPHMREVVFCLACVAVLLVASDLVSWLMGRELLPPFMVKVYQAARDAGAMTLLVFTAVVVAPISEEIMFRGFLFRGWSASRLGGTGTILLTSAIWSAIHVQYDWFGISQVFCLGLLFGWVRWRSGSTALTMLMHAVVNAAATIETVVIVEYLS